MQMRLDLQRTYVKRIDCCLKRQKSQFKEYWVTLNRLLFSFERHMKYSIWIGKYAVV